jgi:osmotically-inducible protein OsmY
VKPIERTRTDIAALRDAIGRALVRHSLAEAQHIQLELADGTVTLFGAVDSQHEHDVIIEAVSGMDGVDRVIDKLHLEAY